jgi:hypothetical protein
MNLLRWGKKFCDLILCLGSAEYVVSWMPNGGTAILIRTILVSLNIFILAIGLFDYLDPNAIFEFSKSSLLFLAKDKFQWIGPIFIAIYVALYSRYAAQWSYLANLYNQIMLAKAQQVRPEKIKYRTINNLKETPLNYLNATDQAFAQWQAGFIADAFELHLAYKEMFKSVIIGMLELPGVKQAFEEAGEENKILLEKFNKKMTS